MGNREKFEKQMRGTFGMLVDLRAREGTGFSYMDWGTQVAWVMWQARVPEGYVVVPEAKDFCQKHINKKINSCIVGVKMTQETERLKNQLLAAEAEIARLQSALDEIKSHIKSHLDEDYDEDDFDRGWLSAFKRINHNVNRITGTDK